MLNLQAIIFYGVTFIYFHLKKKSYPKKVCQLTFVDKLLRYFLIVMVGIFLGLFFWQVGNPPLLEILTGNLDSYSKIISYRTEKVYSNKYGILPIMGLYVLPILTAVYIFAESSLKKKRSYYDYLLIFGCIFIVALPGGKGNILDIVTALFIAYLLLGGTRGVPKARKPIVYAQLLFWLSVALMPVAILYKFYYSTVLSGVEIFKSFVYRIVGVYSESMAATVAYTETKGFLEGITFPRFKGLLHTSQPIDSGEVMSQFIFNSVKPEGSVPVSAFAEGYINFGWIGFILITIITFILIILFQETLNSIPQNLLTFSLIVSYCLFATKISQISIFAFILQPSFTLLFALIIGMRYIFFWFCSEIKIQKSQLRSQKEI
jgi:oligosaccharide repeat unit polymerase